MEIEIIKQKETPLLFRKRITAMVTFTGKTPSRTQLLKELAKKLKIKENLLIIRHIYTRYGEEKAKLIAHAYEKEDIIAKLEGDKLINKHKEKPKEDKKEEVKEKTEEKPKEDKKEEVKEKTEEKPKEDKKEEVKDKTEEKPKDKKEEVKEN